MFDDKTAILYYNLIGEASNNLILWTQYSTELDSFVNENKLIQNLVRLILESNLRTTFEFPTTLLVNKINNQHKVSEGEKNSSVIKGLSQ